MFSTGLANAIINGDNSVDGDLIEPLKDLWGAASKGRGTHKYSAIHFLQLAEDIYDGIVEVGGFDLDWEPEEDGE